MPLGEPFYKISREKDEIKASGIWLSENRDIVQSRLIVNDERIAYYAGLFRGEYYTFLNKRIDALEKRAHRVGSEVVVVYLNKTELDSIPDFNKFSLVEAFPGYKKTVMIYERKI